MATLKKGRGHPTIFTDAQNVALRGVLREMKERRNYSQTALGQILGVSQQQAGNLLKSDDFGFSYNSATRLVRYLRYASVDSFFVAKNVAPVPSEPPRAAVG